MLSFVVWVRLRTPLLGCYSLLPWIIVGKMCIWNKYELNRKFKIRYTTYSNMCLCLQSSKRVGEWKKKAMGGVWKLQSKLSAEQFLHSNLERRKWSSVHVALHKFHALLTQSSCPTSCLNSSPVTFGTVHIAFYGCPNPGRPALPFFEIAEVPRGRCVKGANNHRTHTAQMTLLWPVPSVYYSITL